MKRVFAVIAALLLSVSIAYAEDAPTSTALANVQETIDRVVEIAEALPGDANLKERRAKLREVINPRFDFAEMAKRSLGTNWSKCTPEEQDEFVATFSELLARTYLAKIETVKKGMVKIDSEKVEMPKAIVKTLVTSKGDVFPIEYRVIYEDSAWKVYDVIIENIGLVANYRNEFAGIVRKDGISGLIERLKAKNAAAK